MFPCIPSEPVVPQRRSPASSRVRACAVLVVLVLLASAAAQAAPGPARRPAAPFDLLSTLRTWVVALIGPAADGESGVAARTPDSSREVDAQSTLVNTSADSDAGILIDPDGAPHH